MDSTVIEEIARQLGMAVDQAGQFVAERLPDYARLMVLHDLVPLAIAVIFLALMAVALRWVARRYAAVENGDEEPPIGDPAVLEYAFILGLFITVTVGIIVLICAIVAVPDAVGWLAYPDAQLLHAVLSKVGA